MTGAGMLGYQATGRDDASSPPNQQKVQGEPDSPVSGQARGAKSDITSEALERGARHYTGHFPGRQDACRQLHR